MLQSVLDLQVGVQCAFSLCRQTDFLPNRCRICESKFCFDHRLPHAHLCTGTERDYGRIDDDGPVLRSGPCAPVRTCAASGCLKELNGTTSPQTVCPACPPGQVYCLKHRHPPDHQCGRQPPQPGPDSRRTVSLAAPQGILLSRLQAWLETRKKSKCGSFRDLIKGKCSKQGSSAQRSQTAITALRKAAVGDPKLAEPNRIYCTAETPPPSLEKLDLKQAVSKAVYFSRDQTNGRALDKVCELLSVSNSNNKTTDPDKRLQLYHVEGGALLEPSRPFGESIKTGDTIVLIRGLCTN